MLVFGHAHHEGYLALLPCDGMKVTRSVLGDDSSSDSLKLPQGQTPVGVEHGGVGVAR